MIQINIIDSHHLASINVNHLLVEQVALQQEQALSAFSGSPIRRRGLGPNAPIDRGHGGKRQHPLTVLRFNDQHRDPGAVFLRCQGNFPHTSAGLARCVKHRGAQQFGQCHRGHGVENTQLSARNLDTFSSFFEKSREFRSALLGNASCTAEQDAQNLWRSLI